MPIDGRSPLGQQLKIGEKMDLGELDESAGRLIADRMESTGRTREETVNDLLNVAARALQDTTVILDVDMIYRAHPEVREAVEDRRAAARARAETGPRTGDHKTKEMTVARGLTILIVRGASAVLEQAAQRPQQRPSREPAPQGAGDFFGELVGDMFGGLGGLFGNRRRDDKPGGV